MKTITNELNLTVQRDELCPNGSSQFFLTKGAIMTTALYGRVSTGFQQTGLESQRMALKNWCETKSITDYVLYEDFAVSGTKVSRPSLDKMMNEVRSGKIKRVVVYSFSRFARSTTQLLSALEEFRLLNVEFVSLSEQVDTSSAIGKALFTIISAIATLERDLVSERVKNGMLSAKAKGKRIGRPSTIKPELIMTLHHEGYNQREIAKMLNIGQATVARTLKKHDSKQKSKNHFESELDDSK